ncbi:SDR family NAD(P)-dependent oxidoreductase [Sphingosinicellaceae bacterium]|nr:SDR family NAD(P)-dependent oxidoreductase [Sphingosinicellaceae bacterium]
MPDLAVPHGLVESSRLLVAPLDVRNEAQCAEAVATATARIGHVDALLSNAGMDSMVRSKQSRLSRSRISSPSTCSGRCMCCVPYSRAFEHAGTASCS